MKESLKVFQACLNIEDKQKVNGNLQVDCTEYVKDKYQKEVKEYNISKDFFWRKETLGKASLDDADGDLDDNDNDDPKN